MDVNSDEGEVQTNPLRNQLLVLAATVVAILFTAMSAFQWAEMMFGGTQLGVIDSIYFTMVTSSTIGYGTYCCLFGAQLASLTLPSYDKHQVISRQALGCK